MDPDTIQTGNDHSIGDTADGRHSTDDRNAADERKARSTKPDATCSGDAHTALFDDPGARSRDDGPITDAGASGTVTRAAENGCRRPVFGIATVLVCSATALTRRPGAHTLATPCALTGTPLE
jgi:hypothetical protein